MHHLKFINYYINLGRYISMAVSSNFKILSVLIQEKNNILCILHILLERILFIYYVLYIHTYVIFQL